MTLPPTPTPTPTITQRLDSNTTRRPQFVTLIGFFLIALVPQVILLRAYHDHSFGVNVIDAIVLASLQPPAANVSSNWGTVDLAIFYNAFISPKNVTNGLRIVKEQLAARNKSPTLKNATLYYTHIGATNVSFPNCHNCKQLYNVEEGDESLTLQAMYEYCVANPTKGRVIYIHNKGSFTINEKNERLRRTLTRAVFSSKCTNMSRENPTNGDYEHVEDYCDVCSATVAVYPYLLTPGNMFLAECSYIRKLIPPNQFEERMLQLMHKVWNSTWQELEFSQEPAEGRAWQIERESWVGVGRYSMEHWIYSEAPL